MRNRQHMFMKRFDFCSMVVAQPLNASLLSTLQSGSSASSVDIPSTCEDEHDEGDNYLLCDRVTEHSGRHSFGSGVLYTFTCY